MQTALTTRTMGWMKAATAKESPSLKEYLKSPGFGNIAPKGIEEPMPLALYERLCAAVYAEPPCNISMHYSDWAAQFQ